MALVRGTLAARSAAVKKPRPRLGLVLSMRHTLPGPAAWLCGRVGGSEVGSTSPRPPEASCSTATIKETTETMDARRLRSRATEQSRVRSKDFQVFVCAFLSGGRLSVPPHDFWGTHAPARVTYSRHGRMSSYFFPHAREQLAATIETCAASEYNLGVTPLENVGDVLIVLPIVAERTMDVRD